MVVTTQRSISSIAQEIHKDWGVKVNPAAKPYLTTMLSLEKKTDMYGADKADSIILYFLINASSYRGENAKRLKAELKALK
jgi:hypothetical protein